MKKTKKFLIHGSASLVVLFILLAPALSLAQSTSANTPLVTCNTNCGFNDLMALVNRIVKFMLFDMVLPISAIMCAYAGILMITAGGETAHARTKAKNIFFKAIVGLIIAMSCWLIINTILSILGYNGSWIGFVRPAL